MHTPWIWNPSTLADDDDEQQQQQHQEPGDYTEKRELQPTFSSSIVRTPEHYRSPLARHASMPAAPSWKLPMFSDRPAISDEPTSMFDIDADLGALLSPLVLATPALPPTGLAPRTRHPQTVPATRSLGTIPEQRSRRPEQRPREQLQDTRALTYPALEQRLGTRHTTAIYVSPASTPPHHAGSGPPSPYAPASGPSPYDTPHTSPPGSKEASPGPRTQSTSRRTSEPYAQDVNRRASEPHAQDTMAVRRVFEPRAQDATRRALESHAENGSRRASEPHAQDVAQRRSMDQLPRANPLPPPPQPSAYSAPPLMPSRSASAVLAPAPGPAPTHERRARTSSASAAAAPHTPPSYATPPHSASASASAYAQAQYAAERTAPQSASASASAYAQAQYAAERTVPHSAPAHTQVQAPYGAPHTPPHSVPAQGPYGAPHTPPHSARPSYNTPTHSHSTPTRPTHAHAHSTPTHPAHAHTVPAPTQAYPSHAQPLAYPAQNQNQTHPTRDQAQAHPNPVHPSPPYPTPLSPALPRRPPRVRRGYWNRRGDHLTPTGFLVYAPQHLAFPDELATYPPPHEGYQDDRGAWCRWVARPELRESLPREGRPAEKPYESVRFLFFIFFKKGGGHESEILMSLNFPRPFRDHVINTALIPPPPSFSFFFLRFNRR